METTIVSYNVDEALKAILFSTRQNFLKCLKLKEKERKLLGALDKTFSAGRGVSATYPFLHGFTGLPDHCPSPDMSPK